ncbi:MAG: hypothetical protein WCB68_15255 [Pyrinomonadaceae bacterium]
MVRLEETASLHESRTDCTPIELVTENGYSIVRSCEMDGAGTYKFVVSNSDEQTCEVIVEFDHAAIMLVQSCRRRPLASKSAFWINCAERSLATYLWEKDECPPNGRLTLKDVCLDDLDASRRWG